MSFQQGLSGLNASSKNLEVIGNNVANANTVGFKQSRAEFADVYANSLTGSGSSQIGIGTKLSNVQQQFTQGNISSTNNPLDIAINGGGFFRMTTNGTVTYSRNGQFHLDKEGYIVDAGNKRLTGFSASTTGVLASGSPADIKINTSDLVPKTTTTATGVFNLDSREAAKIVDFDPTDPTTYNYSSPVAIYDSLGNAHTLQNFFVKQPTAVLGDPTTWNVYVTADGAPTYTAATIGPPSTAAIPNATMSFTGSGITPTVIPAAIPVTFAPTTGALPVAITLNYSGSTQFGASHTNTSMSQNGYAAGSLTGFNTGSDGIVVGRYSNGQSSTLGQIVLANFANPNGLQSLGNNAWAESSTSGAALVGTPGTGLMGVLQSSSAEDSNVDLTAELVKMIMAQRIYQANAQTIKTQDQVLQTLVNLR